MPVKIFDTFIFKQLTAMKVKKIMESVNTDKKKYLVSP